MLTAQERAELDRLAHEIATEAAALVVESVCDFREAVKSSHVTARWYDTATAEENGEREDLARAIRYLELQGKLERHSSHSNLVRVTAVKDYRILQDHQPGQE